jgi:sucrose-6-phosphate hydrolase SacC (GH32 family)
MPFNQQMTIPCELTLRKTDQGVRMCAAPVAELNALRKQDHAFSDVVLKPNENLFAGLTGDSLMIRLDAEVPSDGAIALNVRGLPIRFDGAKRELACRDLVAPLAPEEGRVRLEILVDRGSVEVFGNDGLIAISRGINPAEGDKSLSLTSTGQKTRIRSAVVQELESAWK